MLPSVFQTSQAEQLKADYFLTSNLFQPYANFTYQAPYRSYLVQMSNDSTFKNELIAWTTLNFVFNPDEFAGGLAKGDLLSEQGFYEAALFDMLYETEKSDTLLDTLHASIKKCNVGVYKNLFKQLDKGTIDYPVSFDIPLTDEDKAKIGAALYAEAGDSYASTFGSLETFQKLVSTGATIEEMAERVGTMLALEDLSESTVTMLQSMKRYCGVHRDEGSFGHLENALEEIIDLYENHFDVQTLIYQEAASLAVDQILEKASGLIWSDMIDNLGGGWVKLAYSVGKAANNAWISTDARIEKFYEMKSLLDIEIAVQDSLQYYKAIYQNNQTQTNASHFNAGVSMAISTYELGLRYSEGYWTILDTMGLNAVLNEFGEGWSHSDLIAKVSQDRTTMENNYRMANELLDELSTQNQNGHDEAFDEPLYITSQETFDAYCDIYGDMRNVYPERFSNLKVNCPTAIMVDRTCRIGKEADFYTLTIEEGGSLRVEGSASSTYLDVRGGSLLVDGDLRVSLVYMDSDASLVSVSGNLLAERSSYASRQMEAGTFEVGGDVHLEGGYWFGAVGACRVVLCGDGPQAVDGDGGLGNTEFRNPDVDVSITGTLSLAGDAQADGAVSAGTLNLNGHRLTAAKDVSTSTLLATGASAVHAGGRLHVGSCMLEAGAAVDASAPEADFYSLSIEEGGSLRVEGSASSTYLHVNGGSLFADGDLRVRDVDMDSDASLVRVSGALSAGHGGYTSYRMEAGSFEALGDVHLEGGEGFGAVGACRVVLCGDGPQAVDGYGNLGNTINAHAIEKEASIPEFAVGCYIWDPDYHRTNKYLQLATSDIGKQAYVYSGTPIALSPIVSYGDHYLQEGIDFTVSYSNNVNAGTASATLAGLGEVKGSKTESFTIQPLEIGVVEIEPIQNQIYTGSPLAPDATLSLNGRPLEKGIDYELVPAESILPGEATVRINGIGNFEGTVEVPFTIICDGWTTFGNSTYYYQENKPITGETWIDGRGYYFKKTGALVRGAWLTLPDGKTYAGSDGAFLAGQQIIGGKKYYFDELGRTREGFITVGNSVFYYQAEGYATGETWIDGKGYYFKKTGVLVQNAWLDFIDGQVRTGSDGAFLTGLQIIDGKKYLFDEKGRSIEGFATVGASTYYLKDGTYLIGEQKILGKSYYFKKTGILVKNAWLDLVDGRRVYAGNNGAFLSGEQWIGGKGFYFKKTGALVRRTWLDLADSRRVFASEDGSFALGEQWIGNHGYYFNDNGDSLANQWLDLADGRVLTDADGAFLIGYQIVDGKKYLFDERGRSTEGFVTISGTTYYLRDGAFLAGERWIEDQGYYFKKAGNLVKNAWLDLADGRVYAGADGAFLTGEQTIAGEPFSFDDRGRLLQAEASEAPLPPSDPVTEEAAPVVEMPEPGVGEAVASPAEQTLAEGPAADVEDVEEARLSLALLDAVTGERLEGKSYTHPELEALAAEGAEPVSVLCEREDGTYEARTAAAYVTLEALLADAGLQGAWREGAVLLVDGGEGEEAHTFGDLSREGWFYPSATADALVPDGRRASAPVLCFAYTESPILTTAEDSEGDIISCLPIESPFFVMIGLPD